MSLAARSFLYSFLAIGAALAASFISVKVAIQGKVREELRLTLLRQESALDEMSDSHSRQVGRLVAVLGESAGLKAGLGLIKEVTRLEGAEGRKQVRRTLEAQLEDLSLKTAYELLAVADAEDRLVAAVVSKQAKLVLLNPASIQLPASGLLSLGRKLYETTKVPITMGEETLGSLMVGREFNLRQLARSGEMALLQKGKVISTTLTAEGARQVERGIAAECAAGFDGCQIRLAGETHLVMPMRAASIGDGYALISLQSLDAATHAFMRAFGSVFLLIGSGALIIALISSALISHSIAEPLRKLVDKLAVSERTGKLPNDFPTNAPTLEVNRLSEAFNRAADAIGVSQRSLEQANVEFLETMARALDARDGYTAGHSESVSRYSVKIAAQLGRPADEIRRIQIGAKLHDIGKIGIPDAILQKPGKLTETEYKRIQQHPQIGRTILERLSKFRQYLPIVELHHENYDGTGYPRGLKGEETPIEARIVHVADVYDALTSDRAYRRRMPEQKVRDMMREGRGTQFDPAVVDGLFEVLAASDAREARQHADKFRPELERETAEVEVFKSA